MTLIIWWKALKGAPDVVKIDKPVRNAEAASWSSNGWGASPMTIRASSWTSIIASRMTVPLVVSALISVGAAAAERATVTIAVDAGASKHPINPMIYGVAWASKDDLI